MACSSASPVVDIHPEGDGEKPSKKKKGDVSQWKKSVAKRRRNRGQEYVSVGRNKFVPARQVGEPCGCPKRCFEKLGEDTVKLIFDEYWKMGDHNAQSAYLFKMVLSKEVKVPSVGPDSRRKKTYEYGVLINNKRNLLCKKAFLSIHSISETRVWNVLKKVGETGVLPVDRRGTGRPHNKKPDDVLDLAHDHIKSLPTCSSHYSRAKSRYRLYLPPGYTHRHCYDLFQLWCEERNVDAEKIISFDGYSKIFSSYNIGTRPPKVDTYSTCDRLGIELEVATEKKEEQRKKDMELQLTLHKTKASEVPVSDKTYLEVRHSKRGPADSFQPGLIDNEGKRTSTEYGEANSDTHRLIKLPRFAIELIRNDISSSVGASLYNALVHDLEAIDLLKCEVKLDDILCDKTEIDRQRTQVRTEVDSATSASAGRLLSYDFNSKRDRVRTEINKATLADNTKTNTGGESGIVSKLENLKRKVLQHTVGLTKTPVSFSGPLEKPSAKKHKTPPCKRRKATVQGNVFVIEGINTSVNGESKFACEEEEEVLSQEVRSDIDPLGEHAFSRHDGCDDEGNLAGNKDINLREELDIKEEVSIKEEDIEDFELAGLNMDCVP